MMKADGSVLVQGSAPAARTQRVRVLRAFLLRGARQEIDSVVEVSAALADELIYRRAAELAPAEPAPPPAAEPSSPTKPAAKRAPAKE